MLIADLLSNRMVSCSGTGGSAGGRKTKGLKTLSITKRGCDKLRKQIKLFAYENSISNERLQPYFVTITTQQHQTGQTDKQLRHYLSQWLRKWSYYVCVCERQSQTNDIHFHILCWRQATDTYMDYAYERRKLARGFKCRDHPALLQVDPVEQDENYVGGYMSKAVGSYITKSARNASDVCDELTEIEKPVFGCRPISVSSGVSGRYKAGAGKYVQKLYGSQAVRFVQRQLKRSYVHNSVERFPNRLMFQSQHCSVYSWRPLEGMKFFENAVFASAPGYEPRGLAGASACDGGSPQTQKHDVESQHQKKSPNSWDNRLDEFLGSDE